MTILILINNSDMNNDQYKGLETDVNDPNISPNKIVEKDDMINDIITKNDINIENKKETINTEIRVLKSHQELSGILDIYMTHEHASGSVFFKPNGTKIWRALEDYLRAEYKKRGFEEVMTPRLVNSQLYVTSGHIPMYQQNMFKVIVDSDETENSTYYMPSMNCPSHCLMFKNLQVSYKSLPVKMADFGCLHRNECSGSIRGLNRLRKFSQDDAHIFCRHDQIFEQIKECLDFLDHVYKLFGFKYEVTVSTKPEKYMGELDLWIEAETALQDALRSMNIGFTINDKDGAFYGPKIDIMVKDSADRKVQCGTIQLDFQLPLRFNLEYTDNDGKQSTPVMIHRAILGSVERMMSILIEHYQGQLPLWLSPRQVAIIPVANKPHFKEYCNKVKSKITENFDKLDSVHIFDSNEMFNSRIREAEVKLYNYILIIGAKEIDSDTATFRVINHTHNDKKFCGVDDVCDIIKNSYYDVTC